MVVFLWMVLKLQVGRTYTIQLQLNDYKTETTLRFFTLVYIAFFFQSSTTLSRVSKRKPLGIITITDCAHGATVFDGVCLSVCLSVCPPELSKTAAARITKLDTEMFYHQSWKPVYLGVKRLRP